MGRKRREEGGAGHGTLGGAVDRTTDRNAGDVQAMLGLSLTLDLPHRTGTLRHGTSQLLLVSRARSARLR